MTDEQPLIDARIADLGRADGVNEDEGTPMVERDEPWVYEVTDRIVVAVNTDEPNAVGPPDCGMEVDLDPFQMVLFDNGWLAYLGPGGGSHVGTREDEDRWIDALEAEIEALGGDLTPEEADDV